MNYLNQVSTSFVIICLLWISGACQKKEKVTEVTAKEHSIYQMDNLVAWCIVPFDSLNRGPQQRARMLRELGFKKLAYDWRDEHLPTFPEEVSALKENGIELTAVWWWIDGQQENLLGSGNQQLLNYMDSLNISCDIWMSFGDQFFEGLDDGQKLEKAVEAVKELDQQASTVGANLQLYNHGSWFGDPRNQIRIIEQSGVPNLGIVYNFHHAHDKISQFKELLELMMPYLNTVNINGMNRQGPKILAVGAGELETEMLSMLERSGFKGNVGIIGHLEKEDVRLVLERNLKGLQQIIPNL